MSSWTNLVLLLIERHSGSLLQKMLFVLPLPKPTVCKDLHNSFYLPQFKMVRFFVPLNSIEKDLNRQLLSPSTTIGC